MLARCLALLLASSVALFGAFALSGEGPVVAVKERPTVVMGAVGEVAPGAPNRGRLAWLGPVSSHGRMLPTH